MATKTLTWFGGGPGHRLSISSGTQLDLAPFVVPSGQARIFDGRTPVSLRLETVKLPRGVRAVAIELGSNESTRRLEMEGDRLPPIEITTADRLRLIVESTERDIVCRPVVTGRSLLIPHDGSYSFALRPAGMAEPRRLHGVESRFVLEPPFACRAVRICMRAASPDAVTIKRLDMTNVTFLDGPAPCGAFFDEGLAVRTYIMTPANRFALFCEANGPETWLEVDFDVEPVTSEEDMKRVRDVGVH